MVIIEIPSYLINCIIVLVFTFELGYQKTDDDCRKLKKLKNLFLSRFLSYLVKNAFFAGKNIVFRIFWIHYDEY